MPHGASIDLNADVRESFGPWPMGHDEALMSVASTVHLVVDEARCVIDVTTLLDPAEPDVRAAVEAAREILVRLKGKPLLERLERAASMVA